MASSTNTLYEQDFVRWLDQQARALRDAQRAGANLPIDWENLAEEVETLGRSERRELRNRIGTILLHLMKLETSRASDPRSLWQDTIDRERYQIVDGVLADSPSLRQEIPALIARELPRARKEAARSLERNGELTEEARSKLATLSYSEEQVLGDWFPTEPG